MTQSRIDSTFLVDRLRDRVAAHEQAAAAARAARMTAAAGIVGGGIAGAIAGVGVGMAADIGAGPPPKWPPFPGMDGYSTNRKSNDPNSFIGPAGYGARGFIRPTGSWSYTVDFDNDGSVAAQDVTVTQQLDPGLDWSTFQLGSFGFGPIDVNVPPGLTEYQTTVAYQNVDGSSLNVLVALNFNVQTGLLTVTFTSLDPVTGQAPTGVTDGFLPPDNSNGIGEGYVQYTVRPKSGLATGTAINQQASVVFDINAPLATAPALNTIDVNTPTSSVTALPPTETTPSFPVSWSGGDGNGSGIASYNVYVSDDGGPYRLGQSGTTQTSATYTGQPGHTYRFYSVATSDVGLVQPTAGAPQAATSVVVPTPSPAPTPTPTPPPTPPLIIGEQVLFTRKLREARPVGKATVSGFRLEFSAAMNPSTAGDPANYRVTAASSRRGKRGRGAAPAVPIRVQYDSATHSVDLLLGAKQAFARGGLITVVAAPPGGISGASGVPLDGGDVGRPGDDGAFTILPKAVAITRG